MTPAAAFPKLVEVYLDADTARFLAVDPVECLDCAFQVTEQDLRPNPGDNPDLAELVSLFVNAFAVESPESLPPGLASVVEGYLSRAQDTSYRQQLLESIGDV